LMCVYSTIPIIQINFLLYKTKAGENRVESKWERGREIERSGLRE